MENFWRNWRESIILDKDSRKYLSAKVIEKVEYVREADDDYVRNAIDEVVLEYARDKYYSLEAKGEIRKQLYSSVRGYDAIQAPLEDPEVTEIMVNGPDDIFIERAGHLSKIDACFESDEKLEDIVQKIAAGANRIVNEASPIVDARLPGGERVNIIVPPVALNGPVITIRKFPEQIMTVETLIGLGAINTEAADFLKCLVEGGYNLLVSGGTGTGKTTFLNALSEYIPREERIITIEDAAELQLNGVSNLVSLEVRNSNVEGKNGITIRDLIKASLRMRPDRIIVGEVRDGAAFDMLQALNTGHSGMSTGHANSCSDMISRLESMVLQATDIPLSAVKRQIGSAIDFIVQLSRFKDKSRKVTEITEVVGFDNNEVILNPLYRFEYKGEENGKIKGELETTGARLQKTDKLLAAGIEIPKSLR